jgi:6-phosphogluconolactonase
MKHVTVDDRRQAFVAKTEEEAYEFCVQSFIEEAKKAIAARASFSVALSGGQTPARMYELLTEPSSALLVNWPLLDVFWGDERCVPPTDPESNYGQAMQYFGRDPLNQAKIHRIKADSEEREKAAREYEKLVLKSCSSGRLDMILLGIGEDGHTASLFPKTAALKEEQKLFVPNFVPQKNVWRQTITFPAIDQARAVYVIAIGKSKSKILKQIFFGEYTVDEIPAQRLGIPTNPVYYILDKKSAYGLGL